MPQELDRALVAIGLEHAGAAELHEAVARPCGKQRRDVVFALGIEAERVLGDLLAQHAVGADDLLALEPGPGIRWRIRRVIDHEQMIAYGVIRILVAATQLRFEARHRRHLLVEHLVAQALRELYLAATVCETHLEVADLAVDLVRLARGERYAAAVAQCPQRHETERYGLPLLAGRQSGGHAPGRKSHAASPWLFAALGFKPCRYLPAGVRHIFQWPSADSTIP